jgi:hypothetical protein
MKVAERYEEARAALSRKDSVIKSFRAELQKARTEGVKATGTNKNVY